MNYSKILQMLASVGYAISLLGELLMKVRGSWVDPNLGLTREPLSSGSPSMSQDPSTLGVRDEKPDEVQTELLP